MQKNFKKNNKKGFSFIEVMLVVFILSTALVVFIQVITKSMDHSTESRDAIIAAGLAQEGVELVKNIRDNNWADKAMAFSGISNGSKAISYDSTSLTGVTGSVRLKFNATTGFYNISSGEDTKFYRRIEITGDDSNKTVASYVTWENGDIANCNVSQKCVYATITLTKWGGE